MKTTGVCLCDSPLRFEHGYCGRCWNRQFATDAGAHGQPNPLSADAPPVPTAGAGRPSTPAPAASSPDCGWCRQPATGSASIGDVRYCHSDSGPSCYEAASLSTVPLHVLGTTGRPAPAASSPWDTDADDYTEAFGNTDGLRIRAAFEKRTGRP
jgi:hypothetical protein